MLDKIIKILITILLLQLPFLDMLRNTGIRHIQLFGISIIEIGNLLLIFTVLTLTLWKLLKRKKTEILKLLLFLGLVLIYLFLHYQNIIKFDSNIFADANFNFITESFYIIRVYICPLLLVYILYQNREIFNKDFYFKIIKIIIAIISFSIVILNILKLSFISYSPTHDFIKYNMFDYFLFQGDYKTLSSRGWFDSANELSAILFMLFPINIYLLYKEGKKINLALFIFQFLAMILLGTRTSALGAVLICITAFIIYVSLILLKKEKYNNTFVTRFTVVSLICTAYLTISPFMFGRINDATFNFAIQNKEAYTNLENISNDDLESMIDKYKGEYMINEVFLELYPINGDKEFWLKMAKRDRALNNDSRQIKTDILKRIKERNANESDNYYGMGYTLNFMDLERDYVYQFYLFGIFGIMLFIFPYFIILFINFVSALVNFQKNFKLITFVAFMSPLLGLTIAYLSGHVFGWISPMYYLAMFVGFTTVVVYENSKEGDKSEK